MQSNRDKSGSVYSLLGYAVNCDLFRRRKSKRPQREQNDKRQSNNKCDKARDTIDSKVKFEDENFKKRFKFSLFVKFISIAVIAISVCFLAVPWEEWLFSNEELHAILDESGDSEEYFDFLATNDEHIEDVSLHEVNCSKRGYWREQKLGAAPKRCGTLVTDALVTAAEAQTLRKMAQRLIDAIGDTSTYNRESLNLKWVNLHNVFRKAPRKLFSKRDFDLIKNTSELAKYIISYTFEIPLEKLYFTNVTQFTRHRPVTQFSEFRHVDKVRSPSIVVTSILWLSTVDYDFYGGRTEFLTGGPEPFTPILVEPKIGRFAAWTSAYENPHGVKEIYAGDRYALIFAFTVNPKYGHKTLDGLKEWALDPANIPKKRAKKVSQY